METIVRKLGNGVFNVMESDWSSAGVGFTVSDRNYILVEESEFDFELYTFNNGIARKSDYAFQLYDVNGKTAVLCEFNAINGAEMFPVQVIRFMAASLVHSKYPGIDCNATAVNTEWADRISVVVGSSLPVIEFEAGY